MSALPELTERQSATAQVLEINKALYNSKGSSPFSRSSENYDKEREYLDLKRENGVYNAMPRINGLTDEASSVSEKVNHNSSKTATLLNEPGSNFNSRFITKTNMLNGDIEMDQDESDDEDKLHIDDGTDIKNTVSENGFKNANKLLDSKIPINGSALNEKTANNILNKISDINKSELKFENNINESLKLKKSSETNNTDSSYVKESMEVENSENLEESFIEDESKENRRLKQKKAVELLKEELQCEEATLNLLRKLLESQRGKSSTKIQSRQNNLPSLHPKPPPPQIAPKVPIPPSKSNIQQPNKPAQPIQKYYIQVGNQLVAAPAPASAAPASANHYQYSNGVSSSSYQPAPPKPPQPIKQTPEQKQNAAKAALRRQLEQTLLQIPPPRPPPADWRAIPNVNSMDFMMLVGLDEVVDSILDADKKPTLKSALEELMPYNPRICSQCNVDFSPCWKKKESDTKEYVLCERCSLQNVKKELKAEHTARLKSAFLKALKQEQEIEEKIKAGEDVNIGNLTGNEKENRDTPPPQARISSPRQHNPQPLSQQTQSNTHVPSPTDRHSTNHHHRHQVVQHYPHHTSLVQQLHHQHIQQQQLELEPPSSQRHSNSRWHPYGKPHHRDSHHSSSHHRSYVPVSSNTPVNDGSPHQEFYLVHHPTSVRYISR